MYTNGECLCCYVYGVKSAIYNTLLGLANLISGFWSPPATSGTLPCGRILVPQLLCACANVEFVQAGSVNVFVEKQELGILVATGASDEVCLCLCRFKY